MSERIEQGLKYFSNSKITNDPPKYKHDDDACFDIQASFEDLFANQNFMLNVIGKDITSDETVKIPNIVLKPGDKIIMPTGLYIECAHGWEVQIRPRSGLSSKGIHVEFGTIDENYRGEIGINISNQSNENFIIKHGDRIAQGAYRQSPKAMFIKINSKEELSQTERGENGFGSTGIK
jgi:dUTP pyrophosphatase